MRNRSFATLGTLALLGAASAFGQQIVRADIPFEFNIAGKLLPAGNYDVSCTSGVVTVRSHTDGAFTMAGNIVSGGSEAAKPSLVFNRYGDKYFLEEVWSSPDSTHGASLMKSKAEREIARANPDVARVILPVGSGVAALIRAR
jgi:hypothetical protein